MNGMLIETRVKDLLPEIPQSYKIKGGRKSKNPA